MVGERSVKMYDNGDSSDLAYSQVHASLES